RTTPDCVSTSGPLEPSPGNGPAVSSGIGIDVAPLVLVVDDDAADVVDGEVVGSAASEPLPLPQAAATATTAAPPRNCKAWRRCSRGSLVMAHTVARPTGSHPCVGCESAGSRGLRLSDVLQVGLHVREELDPFVLAVGPRLGRSGRHCRHPG